MHNSISSLIIPQRLSLWIGINSHTSVNELFINVLATILGGLLLALLLFFLSEYLLPKPNIIGEWKATITIKKANVKTHIKLKKESKIHLLQKDLEITGSGEWIKETDADGNEVKYETQKRVRMEVEGYIERNYLRKSKMHLHIIEEGMKKETSSTYFLNISSPTLLVGSFISIDSSASGTVVLRKNSI